MFTCHACMRRCLRTLTGDIPLISSSSNTALASITIGLPSLARQYTQQQEAHSEQSFVRRHDITSSDRHRNKRQDWIESRGVRPSTARPRTDLDAGISKQLQYLTDPLKLAEHVRRALVNGDFDNTLELVRAASRNMQCIVSWNHLLDYQFSLGHLKQPIKTYNEVWIHFQVRSLSS